MKTMKIEIKGVEFSNKGAELMLRSIIAVLDEQFDDYQLVLSPGSLLPFEKRAALGAWQKFSFKFLGVDWTWLGNIAPAVVIRQLKHFGIVVEKDIDVVLDASGFVYSDKWGSRRLKETLKQLKRIARHHHHYLFLPQAFGPFEDNRNRRLMTQILKLSRLVISRDQQSYLSLKPLDGMCKAQCFPDFTPLLQVDDVKLAVKLPEKFVCIIPNHKMFAGKTLGHHERYLQFLIEGILTVQVLGLVPVLLNHEGDKDLEICQTLVDRLPNKPLLMTGFNALEVKKIISLSVFCLSSRFHGCVSGLSQGVPTLATSWSHKYEALYEYYQCNDYLIPVDNATELKVQMASIVEERQAVSERLLQHSQVHKQTIREMWQKVFSLI